MACYTKNHNDIYYADREGNTSFA